MNQYPQQGWNSQQSDPHGDPHTTQFGPVPQQPQYQQPPPHQSPQQPYGYAPPEKKGMSTPLVVALTVLIVVLIGLVVAAAFLVVPRLIGTTSTPATSTVSVTATAPNDPNGSGANGAEAAQTVQPARPAQGTRPAGAYECHSAGSGPYDSVAVGSSVTSCEFAEAVWSQYVRTGNLGQSTTVRAYSPVTGMSYTMSCSGGAVVTCTGGNNAVVHIY